MAAAPQGVESTTVTVTTTTTVTTTEVEHDKNKPKRDCRTMWSARAAFLRTKRAIAGITIFVVLIILLICKSSRIGKGRKTFALPISRLASVGSVVETLN